MFRHLIERSQRDVTVNDKDWAADKIPMAEINIPPENVSSKLSLFTFFFLQIPDQDAEFNLLIRESQLWEENRPVGYCFDHSHVSKF
ncbi:hypothetical protein M3Y94_00673300 [Aphelenchoides besseyi]|nr:hypothetical protein M3Y94_00673300 [Aphelenchoides besseyi]KAI6231363.1 hypothetical protein M3Y95_00373600 [Aphelenchoides besseyi]